MHVKDLPTPSLILDIERLEKNLNHMAERAQQLGVQLRPHVKTAKCAEVSKRATKGQAGGITVSTLKEAEYFCAHGFEDIIYGVGIVPGKMAAIDDIQQKGATVRITLDNPEMAHAIVGAASGLQTNFGVTIEINSGANRGGVLPEDDRLIEIGQIINKSRNLRIQGVLSHAGHAYLCQNTAAIIDVAEQERAAVVLAAKRLEAANIPCAMVSVGSTPTALFAQHLDGITEMRPGVYTLFDISQQVLGCCNDDDIAVSVLASVINHNEAQDYALVDAGALALSQDVSTDKFGDSYKYGAVYDETCENPVAGIRVSGVQQEHGFLSAPTSPFPFDQLPLGSKVRILPIHACMTAAPYDKYYVVKGNKVIDVWDKLTGW